jgi:ABC-2 type transport system permease protein
MVAPVSRVSIALGRIAGGVTTSLLQALLILAASIVLGFRVRSGAALLGALGFMILISFAFIGLGLIFASRMKDMQGFGLVMNFLVFPLFFLSGAFYPLTNLPWVIRSLSFIDPLTYGIDGLRAVLIESHAFPLALDFLVLAGFAAATLFLGAYFFEKSESV